MAGPAVFGAAALVAATLSLLWWRANPRLALGAAAAFLTLAGLIDWTPPDVVLVILFATCVLAGDRFEGRAAWLAGVVMTACVLVLTHAAGPGFVGVLVISIPAYAAGVAVRLHRRTAARLAERTAELEREEALFADVAVRNERVRIARELHDVVGHALSAVVVQAAAGQRLVDSAPDRAAASLDAIGSAARQGRDDIHRLVELLGGSSAVSADLRLVRDLVEHAARTGIRCTYRVEGETDGVSAEVAHAAYRIVQEGLTNALRHAPGADVRVVLRGSGDGSLSVVIDNDPPHSTTAAWEAGSGRGLTGLRERVAGLGGSFSAGPLPGGGWSVRATVPAPSPGREVPG